MLFWFALLCRKSTSLEGPTKDALVTALCQAVRKLCASLQHRHRHQQQQPKQQQQQQQQQVGSGGVVSQSFRDSLACHVYFLYSYVVLMEQQQSQQALLSDDGKDASAAATTTTITRLRKRCVDTLLEVATTMSSCRTTLWIRGVVGDESLVLLPCRAAYRLLEKSKGVLARKAACGDEALQIVSVTLQQSGSTSSYHTTITATIVDLMHSYEHMAGMASELASTNDRLAIELLRELARVGPTFKEHNHNSSSHHNNHKASGIALAAPFVPHLASSRPKLVLQHAASYVLPLLQAECYQLRSAVVQTLAHLLEYLGQQQQQQQPLPQSGSAVDDEGGGAVPPDSDGPSQDRIAGDITKTRDALLDLLAERAYDVSSFTRAASLKAWMALSNAKALPKTRMLAATQLAMDRLQDKTVVVRKQAMQVRLTGDASTSYGFLVFSPMPCGGDDPPSTHFFTQLLTTLLENHPFLESLDPKPYRDKLQDLYDWVKAHLPESINQAHQDNLQALHPEHEETYQAERMELEQAALSAALAEADALLSEQGTVDQLSAAQQEYCNKVQALKFTQSALDFIDTLENATTALESMLLSASTSDVVEALRFFVQARHFQLPCAVTGMKRALALLWSTEQAIRDEVLKSFVDVFVAVPGTDGQELLPDQVITQNLLLLTGQASVSELASIEEAVQRLVQAETIPPNVFLMLWSIASKGSSDARAAAVRLLSMGASADRSIMDSKSRLKLLLDAGFGKYSRKHRDWRLVGAAAVALQKVERATVDPTDAKYLVQERLLEQLQVVARGEWCDDTELDAFQWFPAAEQAVKAIFAVSPEPERMGRDVLLQMHHSTLSDASAVNPVRLARFFHVLGQVSLELLVYTESLCGSVRRANSKKSMQRQEDADKAKAAKRGTAGRNDNDDEDCDNAIEAELGIAAEVEAENEREMSEISEQEIVGRGLIGQFVPMLTQVVANEGQRFGQVQILSQAAMLALVKLMCVSSKFCESNLGLLFTALSNAPAEDTTMRANTVVALGDLAFRFPNEVEPYTPHLYACLRDPSTKVRRHTLMVTTHLILNDMIRVKGQVSEIALCLRDDDPRIRDMSRLLFHELSKRTNNPVYNLLPDIISTLGSSDAVRKEDFRSIMSFLLGFIKKDRQNDMLVDKLLHRFPAASSVSHKADLTFCIAQLKMSEKSLKCLNEQFKLYEDALHDDDVSKQFLSIAAKAKKKFATGDARALVDDWEAKLTQAAARGAENEAADEDAARASGKARRQKVTAAKKKNTAKKPAVARIPEGIETEDEEEDLAFPEDSLPRSTKKSARKQQQEPRRRRPVKRVIVDDDEESSGSAPSAHEDSDASMEKENAPQMRADPTPPPPPRRRPRQGRGQASATN